MLKFLWIFLIIGIFYSYDFLENRPVHSYSIVAYDDSTGQLGVAVQSHWFSVGSLVPWAKAGVGAVATQSLVKVEYGPDGLKGMEDGKVPYVVLSELLADDDGRDLRQVAMIDANGNVVRVQRTDRVGEDSFDGTCATGRVVYDNNNNYYYYYYHRRRIDNVDDDGKTTRGSH
mgnify:CR=1 FL=1